jgi:DNA adenine methylase
MAPTQAITASLLGEWYERVNAAKPFLRWAGGKSLFVTKFGKLIPPFEGRYFEPFLGSAAMFFHVQRRLGRPVESVLGDVNAQLIRMYAEVKQRPEQVVADLSLLQKQFDAAEKPSDLYYDVRRQYNAALPAPSAGSFIFINRTCWNGLYRVNRKGQYNVPYGRPKTENVVPGAEELLNASAALVRARLRATSWENCVAPARPGDFIFLDPPYYSDVNREEGKRKHAKYKIHPFDLTEHERLATRLKEFARRGIDFLLTNSGEQEMIDLYCDHGLTVNVFQMPRNISSKPEERGDHVPEILVSPPADGQTPARVYLNLALTSAFQREA